MENKNPWVDICENHDIENVEMGMECSEKELAL